VIFAWVVSEDHPTVTRFLRDGPNDLKAIERASFLQEDRDCRLEGIDELPPNSRLFQELRQSFYSAIFQFAVCTRPPKILSAQLTVLEDCNDYASPYAFQATGSDLIHPEDLGYPL
jgi:hypothetical protein